MSSSIMRLEEQRNIHEELERLEEAIAERLREEPTHIRDRLARDHDVARHLRTMEECSARLREIYEDRDAQKLIALRKMAIGDPMESFMKEIEDIKIYHNKYSDLPVDNMEQRYKRPTPEDRAASLAAVEAMFTGEEGFGRFFDLIILHDQHLNLPGQQGRRVSYLQFLDVFDNFEPPNILTPRQKKVAEPYLSYVRGMQEYLESFMRRTKPLENLDKLFENFGKEFDELWEQGKVPGWEVKAGDSNGERKGPYCEPCQREFAKEETYKSHLEGKRHKKAVERATKGDSDATKGDSDATKADSGANNTDRSAKKNDLAAKERAVAEREFRIRKLAGAMQTERSDTKVNVERKQGMTDRERQQELEQLLSGTNDVANGQDDEDNDEGEDKIYNPLKLPLAWDGKPIPFWLYKLHGLGVEFPCEICGNYVYMGRRAFDKHFNESRHLHGLKCLGIDDPALFREITNIAEAQSLWKKIQLDKKKEKSRMENVVQMEDSEGNVMPEKVYMDLKAQGLI